MKLWFSSTKYGMTLPQKLKVQEFLVKNKEIIKTIRHEDFIGGEEEFHRMCLNFDLFNKIIIHPPKDRTNRALCKASVILDPMMDSTSRRSNMAIKSDFLLATPHSYSENIRKGCWQSIRIAKQKEMDLLIVFPDGSLCNEYEISRNKN